MSNKLKKTVKNLQLKVNGGITDGKVFTPSQLNVIITNDEVGKTISIHDGEKMYVIPFEPLEQYLK
jgi:hypothetical protein